MRSRTLSRQFDVTGFRSTYHNDYGTVRVSPQGYVHNLVVQERHRGQGYGSALMRQITLDADRLQRPLTLNARNELHPWYGRMGFIPDASSQGAHLEELTGEPTLRRSPRRY